MLVTTSAQIHFTRASENSARGARPAQRTTLLGDASLVGFAQTLRHDLEQTEGKFGIAFDELEEGPSRDRHRQHGGLGENRGRAGAAIEKRELSEEVSRSERDAPSSRKIERRLAVENDEEGLSPLALANEGRARGEAAGAREIRDPLHVPLRERREKRNPVKDIDPFRAERLVARPGSGTED